MQYYRIKYNMKTIPKKNLYIFNMKRCKSVNTAS